MTGRGMRHALWVACAVVGLSTCAHQAGDRRSSGEPSPRTTATDAHASAGASATQFQTIEWAVPPGTRSARFVGPDGTALEVRSFSRGGREVVRWTPTEPGIWRVEAPGAELPAAVTVAPDPRRRGFVRIDGRHFEFSDDEPLVAIGENRINIYDPRWNYLQLSAPDYVRYMAEHGMTVLRVFVVSDVEDELRGGAVNLGVLEPRLGEFDERVAGELDEIFRAAEQHGVYVVLVAFALGFSEKDAWKHWDDNPYSKLRGGPAATRYDFFEQPEPRAAAARRLEYLAARYAHSTSFLAIDLLNEPEWDGEIPEVSWTAWGQEMARVWREADPYERPVTIGSVGLHWNIEGDEREWWASPAADIVQWHLYGKEIYDVHALAAEMTRKVRETWEYGKPVLIGEFAYGGEPKPEYDHTHVGLWVATFSGAFPLAHSAPPFNLDSDELMTPDRARHFRVLRDFMEPFPAMAPLEASATAGVRAWALGARDAGAIWLMAPKQNYGEPVKGAEVTVRGVREGRWLVTWIDDVSGAALGESIETVEGASGLRVRVPSFRKHVAGRYTPAP